MLSRNIYHCKQLKQSNEEKIYLQLFIAQKYSDPFGIITPHIHIYNIRTYRRGQVPGLVSQLPIVSDLKEYKRFLELGLRLANKKGYVRGDYV